MCAFTFLISLLGRSNIWQVFLSITQNKLSKKTTHMDIAVSTAFPLGNPGYRNFRANWMQTQERSITEYFTHKLLISPKFNSLWPSDALQWHRSGSTLAQIMASCLMAPSHYLNQYWLIINQDLRHSPEGSFTENDQDIYSWFAFENY